MYINFVPDLFLEVTELTRFKEALDDFGFRKAVLLDSVKFGLVKSNLDPNVINGRVERDVDNALNQKTIKIAPISAINNQGQFISNPQVNNFAIPADGNWYWLKISHRYSTLEAGKVSIDASGNLIGVGTEFVKMLRGNPNFPTVIRFSGSVGNTLEYEVGEVVDDTHAMIVHPAVTGGGVADFIAESNLNYEIVGTFTDGVAVPTLNKLPFKYDSCNLQLVLETTPNVHPAHTPGQEFYLARVKVNVGNLVIQDKRTEFWESKGSDLAIEIERTQTVNPLIGVESAKWQNVFNTGDRNIVEIAWGMRSTNWAVDSSLNILTLFGSSKGGSFKTTADFTDGDFNGWRVYTANGKYNKVTNSIKQGDAINLYLDILDVDDFSTDGGITFTGNEILVTPDCSDVEIKFTANVASDVHNVDDIFTFPVNTPVAKCLPTVYIDQYCFYNVMYRYIAHKEYTEWTPISSGSYLTETSFNKNGSLKPSDERVEYPYVSDLVTAFVRLEISPDSFNKFRNTVYKGDIIGVQTLTSFAAGQSLDLRVGVSKRYQYITGSINVPDDVYISLSRTGAVEGNEFRLHFDCSALNLGTKKIIIADDYTSGTLTILKEITQGDSYAMLNQDGGIVIDCVFDDTGKWIAYQNYDLGSPNEVKMFSGDLDACFDVSGLGKVKGYFGYALMNGQNGTVDVSDRFIVGTKVNDDILSTGGASEVTLAIQNIPSHSHKIHGKVENRSTGTGFEIIQPYKDGPAGGVDFAPSGNTGGEATVGNPTRPFSIVPRYCALAYIQKLY